MEKKRKKKSAFGTFYQMSPGNVEQNIERFNNSVQDGGMKTVCAEDLELREDNNSLTPQERQELKNLINTANDIDAITSYINAKIQDKKGMNEALSLSEDEFDTIPNVEVDVIHQDEIELPGPQTHEDFECTMLLSELIQNIWALIDRYNSILISIDNEDIKELLKDLVDDEMKNIGRLEDAMTSVSPNAENIKVD